MSLVHLLNRRWLILTRRNKIGGVLRSGRTECMKECSGECSVVRSVRAPRQLTLAINTSPYELKILLFRLHIKTSSSGGPRHRPLVVIVY